MRNLTSLGVVYDLTIRPPPLPGQQIQLWWRTTETRELADGTPIWLVSEIANWSGEMHCVAATTREEAEQAANRGEWTPMINPHTSISGPND
jgi:hypothetical protein